MKLYQAGTDFITVTDGTITNGSGFSVTVSGGVANKFAFTSTVTGNQTVSSTASVGPFAVQLAGLVRQPGQCRYHGDAGPDDQLDGDHGPHAVLHHDLGWHHRRGRHHRQRDLDLVELLLLRHQGGHSDDHFGRRHGQHPDRLGDDDGGFTMVAGTANKFAFTSTVSGNQTVSSSASVGPFAVQVQDQFGNPVPTPAPR